MSLTEYLRPSTPMAIAFDDDCGLCRAVRGWVAPLVPPGRGISLDSAQAPAHPELAAIDPACRLEAIHAVADGRILSGFSAMSALLRRTAVGLPLAPALALMEFTPIGGWVYRALARRRRKSCQVPARRGPSKAPSPRQRM